MLRRMFCKLGATGLASMAISKQISALEKVAGAPAAKKWAIVYGSMCGSTKQVAEWINKGMDDIADVLDVENSPDIDAYDYFVIGGWINTSQASGNKLIDTVANFVKNNKEALKPKITGLFTVCGNGGNLVGATQIKNYLTNEIVKFSGVNDKPAKLFNGKNDPSCSKSTFPPYDKLDQNAAVAFGKEIYEPYKVSILDKPVKQSASQMRLALKKEGEAIAIAYNLPVSGRVELTVCSIHGQRVTTVVSQYQNAGSYRVPLSGKNLAPGHYICRLEAAGILKTICATVTQ
jgi:flavodoxin